jgi:hypothetical protein
VATYWPLFGVAALVAAAHYPILLGRFVFNRDLSRFLYPIRWFVGDSLRRGDGPWWTPHIGLGHAMLADPQSAIFYPINVLHLLGSLPLLMNLICLLHVVWGAIGMVKVARAFNLDHVPALIAGLSWALSGYIVSLWTNGARLPSAAWMPWQILAFLHVARTARDARTSLRPMAWLALATAAAITAGDVFVAMMGAMVGLGLAGAWLFGDPRVGADPSQQTRISRAGTYVVLGGSLVATSLGVLVAGAALLPAALALQGTERSDGVSSIVAQAGSLHPIRLFEFAAPEAFARAWYEAGAQPWVSTYLDGAPLSLSLYFGGSVLVLLLLSFLPARKGARGISEGRRLPHTTPLIVAAVAGFFLLVAFGRHTPVFAVVRALVVPIRYLRAPEKFLLAVVPCVALLAGWGAHRLLGEMFRWRWRWGIAALIVACGWVLLVPSLLPPGLGEQVQRQAWHGLMAGMLVLAAVDLAGRRPVAAGAFLVLLVLVDLSTSTALTLRFTSGAELSAPAVARAIQPRPTRPELPFPRLFRGSKVQLAASQTSDLDGDEITWQSLRDNLGVPLGVDILPGYGVAIPPALTQVLGRGRLDALRLLSVDFALLSAPAATTPVPKGLVLMESPLPGVRLYKIEHSLPRAFVASRATKYPDSELARHLLDAEVVTGATVLLDDREPWTPPDGSTSPPTACTLSRFHNTSVRASCESTRPGLAVFVEQYATGWRATVDGHPAPLFKVNAMMRAVPILAGAHTIDLVYEPPGLATGVWLSLFGLIAILMLFLAARWRAVSR